MALLRLLLLICRRHGSRGKSVSPIDHAANNYDATPTTQELGFLIVDKTFSALAEGASASPRAVVGSDGVACTGTFQQ